MNFGAVSVKRESDLISSQLANTLIEKDELRKYLDYVIDLALDCQLDIISTTQTNKVSNIANKLT